MQRQRAALAGTASLLCTVFLAACGQTGISSTGEPRSVTPQPAPTAPVITTQPAAQSVTAGQSATFAVVASGAGPLSYQWQKNGTAIAAATSASYTTPPASLADSGTRFSVVVSNAGGARGAQARSSP